MSTMANGLLQMQRLFCDELAHISRRSWRTLPRRKFASTYDKPRLSFDVIAGGEVVADSQAEVVAGKEVVVFLHGLLGNAKNLRTPAKHITRHLPQYAALVMDLRGHGGSSSSRGRRFPPPHNFDACAQDVVETLKQLGLTREKSPFAIVGHSLGGRVALQYSSLLSRDSATIGVNAPSQTYLLDTVPGQADPSVHSVLKAISSVQTIESKASLVDTMMREYRISKPVAAWIASNVYRTENGLDWVFDLDVANELVSNFSDQNLVEQIADVSETPSKPLLYQSMTYDAYQDNCDASQVHLVVGGKNKLWTSDVLEDLRSVPSFGTSKNSMFQMHTLDDAGHWVHVDCLEGLVKVLVDNLQSRMHTVLSDDDH